MNTREDSLSEGTKQSNVLLVHVLTALFRVRTSVLVCTCLPAQSISCRFSLVTKCAALCDIVDVRKRFYLKFFFPHTVSVH